LKKRNWCGGRCYSQCRENTIIVWCWVKKFVEKEPGVAGKSIEKMRPKCGGGTRLAVGGPENPPSAKKKWWFWGQSKGKKGVVLTRRTNKDGRGGGGHDREKIGRGGGWGNLKKYEAKLVGGWGWQPAVKKKKTFQNGGKGVN